MSCRMTRLRHMARFGLAMSALASSHFSRISPTLLDQFHPSTATNLACRRRVSGLPSATRVPPSWPPRGQLSTRIHHRCSYLHFSRRNRHFICLISMSPPPFELFSGDDNLSPARQTAPIDDSLHDWAFETDPDPCRGHDCCLQSSPSRWPILHFLAIFQPTTCRTRSGMAILPFQVADPPLFGQPPAELHRASPLLSPSPSRPSWILTSDEPSPATVAVFQP